MKAGHVPKKGHAPLFLLKFINTLEILFYSIKLLLEKENFVLGLKGEMPC